MKIRVRSLVFFLTIVLLLLQVILQKYIGIMQFLDEFVGLCSFTYIVYYVTKKKANSVIVNSMFLIGLIIVIGLCSNYRLLIQTRKIAIITDIINLFKCFISFLGFYLVFENMKDKDKRELIRYTSNFCKLIIVPGFFLAILNLFFNINMHTDYVYGLRAFHFIFLRVGNLKAFCVRALIIMTISFLIENKKTDKKYIFMTLVLLISTLRTRAFIDVFLYIVGYLYFIKGKRLRIKKVYIIPLGIILYYISSSKIRFYFGNTNRARYVLLKYGLKTAKNYFPFGAGFSTYGTYAAHAYWSSLYSKYSFNKYFGLSKDAGSFLTDNYWPAIMGEFGFVGVILFVLLIYNISKMVLSKTKNIINQKFIALYGLLVMIVESFVSSSFFSPTSVLTMMIIALSATYKGESNDENTDIKTITK